MSSFKFKVNRIVVFFSFYLTISLSFYACSSSDEAVQAPIAIPVVIPPTNSNPLAPYANINFNNWKLTLPVDEDNNGKPDEYSAAQLKDFGYRTLAPIMPFMYDDTTDESIVFYTYPSTSTPNSSYSRTELREMINPTNSKVNWTLADGGVMEGKLKMLSVSPNTSSSSYDFHRVIVMQIHGIISQDDMDANGFTSNNGPPLLKMYWIDGHLKAYKKTLVDPTTTGLDLLDVSSATWTDISHDFGYVGYEPFHLKIIASTGKLEVILNETNTHIFEDISLAKWPFENYFKAGNYLISTDASANATIKYYELSVTH